MLLVLITLILCLLFFGICYLNTGSDEKNLKSFRSYPDAVQSMLKADEKLKGKIPQSSNGAVFASNVITFTAILFFAGLPLRQQTFFMNFLHILVIGETINAFDFFVMDLMWFRHTKRTRFRGTEDNDALYRDPSNHRKAFLRGIPAFLVAAVLDGLLLTWIG